MTLVDTNVLLDLATDDPRWAAWSVHQLEAAATRGPLVVNPVIYAELSVGFDHREVREVSLIEDEIEAPRLGGGLHLRPFEVRTLRIAR